MILKKFPDLKWIQKQSKTNFENLIAEGNVQLSEKGWPSVVLNTTSHPTQRTKIKAPFSLFSNIKGRSTVTISGKNLSLSEDTFCLINSGELYDLTILEDQTQTFNIHFGERLYSETIDSITRTHQAQLDNPELITDPVYHPLCTYWKDSEVKVMVDQVRHFYTSSPVDQEKENILLADFITVLMIKGNRLTNGLERLDIQKKATRKELFHRVSLARDYIHDQFQRHITLEELAQTAMLSKYHFLRVFKAVYGCSPYRYISQIRLQKAKSLLKGGVNNNEISTHLGFEETNSFFAFFKKQTGLTPTQYRFKN